MTHSPEKIRRSGLLACFAAYVFWGVSGIFFKTLAAVQPLEVVAHRVVWGLLALAVAVVALGLTRQAIAILCDRRKLVVFIGSALFVTLNWLAFVHAVGSGHALEASLGYYILPLVTVAMGVVVLKERFSRQAVLALPLVVGGVAVLVIDQGGVPWLALSVAITFAIYSLLRKTAPADSLVGLFVETLLLAPFAIGYIVWREASGSGAFWPSLTGEAPWETAALLVIGTPLWTALPLFLFGYAARRLPLSTVGLMQYMNPSMQFLIATLVFGEPFGAVHLAAFALIWAGLAVFSWSALRPGSDRNSALAKDGKAGDH